MMSKAHAWHLRGFFRGLLLLFPTVGILLLPIPSAGGSARIGAAPLAQEPIHWDVVQRIREEGFERSHIMEDLSWLTDVYGPRLPKSPSYLQAAEWSRQRFQEYGLQNVVVDPYGEFGVGWRNDYTSVHMMTPQYMPLIAYPQSWSAPTNGKRRGPVVPIDFDSIESLDDLEPYRGRLQDAIVFSRPKRLLPPNFEPDAVLLSDERLDRMAARTLPPPVENRAAQTQRQRLPRREMVDFLLAEGITAIAAHDGIHDDGTVRVTRVPGAPWAPSAPQPATELVIAVEHYNRIMRVLEKGIEVIMEVEVRVTLTADDLTDYNVIAEIPGSDLAHEVVVVGAHLDAHGSATGAEDNATGAAQVIEAARILSAIGVEPHRTIRFALWGAEEVGHVGSRAYVRRHYLDPETGRPNAAHADFAGYFNLDYGTGRIRGVYLMGNLEARPIFEAWMQPFRDIGMAHAILVPAADISSDHEQFEAVGLPVFPFLQDPVENDSRTFHTNMDVYDRVVPEYLMQGAVIVASFAYHAAMRDEKLPRLR